MNAAEKKEERSLMVALGIILVVLVVLAIIGFVFMKPPAEIVQGQAEATAVRISGKLPGRIAVFFVDEGDYVKAGDTLVYIHSSMIEARLMQAQAMEDAAAAQNRKVDAGTRSQVVQSAYEMWQQAVAAQTIARKTYDRMESLYNQNVVSAQKRDEALAALQASTAAERAAKSQYDLALSGAQSEDRASAAALVAAAQGGIDEVMSVLDDRYLIAPCDGQIDEIYPHEGELVATGAPIMSLLKRDDMWVTFNVREEMLEGMPIGGDIEIEIPALGMKKAMARIYYSRDMGSYATWRATKPNGEWDSRTFQVKARPVDSVPDLRPGMTIIYKP